MNIITISYEHNNLLSTITS